MGLKKPLATLFLFLGWPLSAVAAADDVASADEQALVDSYLLMASYGEDSAYAFTVGADWSVTNSGRLQVSGGYAHVSRELGTTTVDENSRQASLDWDQRLGNWGVALGGEYWGDSSAIASYTGRARVYYQGEGGQIGMRFERRSAEISYDLPPALRPYVADTRSVNSNAYGLNARIAAGALGFYTDARYYDYDEPIELLFSQFDLSRVPPALLVRLQERIDTLRLALNRINASSLRLSNNLLDYALVLGSDYRAGQHLLNLEFARDRAALDGVLIDSASLGWVIPLGTSADVELRIATTHLHTVGSSISGAISFSLYRIR